jgi:hypothetical protein
MQKIALLFVSSVIGVCGSTTAFANLIKCQPVKNCRADDKPCFVEVTQRNWSIAFVGEDSADNPLRPRAAIRIRACTGVDDVCSSGTKEQRFNWHVVNQVTGAVFGGQLGSETGIWDTGGYTEIGPHTFFGGACLNGTESCKIAWQYCQLELPLAAPDVVAVPGLKPKLKKPYDLAPRLTSNTDDFVSKNLLFAR